MINREIEIADLSGWGNDIDTSLYQPNYNLTPKQPANLQNRSTNPAKNKYADFNQAMNQTQYAK